jgi:hypothetical protein
LYSVRRPGLSQRRAVPALQHRERGHVQPFQARQLPDRLAERQHGAHRAVLRYAEQGLDSRLLGDGDGRNGAAEAFVARGQQDVPDQGIDRGAAHHAHAGQFHVGGGDHAQVDADHQHHRRVEQRLRHRARNLGARDGLWIHAAGHHACPRILARPQLGDVAPGTRQRELGQRVARLRSTDHQHPRPLAIAAARREARIVQDAVEDVIRQRVAGEFPRREGGAHRLVQFHVRRQRTAWSRQRGGDSQNISGLSAISGAEPARTWRSSAAVSG